MTYLVLKTHLRPLRDPVILKKPARFFMKPSTKHLGRPDSVYTSRSSVAALRDRPLMVHQPITAPLPVSLHRGSARPLGD